MKKIIYLFILSVSFSFSACSEWLDVSPSTEKDRADLIETENGFKEMLYGCYINMASASLYGHELTYGALEGFAKNYVKSLSSNYKFTDTAVRPTIDDIWSKMYNNIANINSILNDIENKKDLFYNNEGDILEGEALTMRAFMHFDLLRMFAPAYQGNESTIAIPYVESYERARYPHISESKVVEKILADLDKAEKLFKDATDPIMSELTVTASGKGDFLANRQYRFNYWAVLALKARVYLYANNKEAAKEYAMKVINEGPFKWIDPSVLSGEHADKVFMSEIICALNVPKLSTYYDSYFTSEKYSLSDGWGMYGLTVFEDGNDYRYLYLLTNDKDKNKVISSKYDQNPSDGATLKKETVPLIRLGEMYLIAAECDVESNPTETISLLRELKFHRGYLLSDRGISDNATPAQLQGYVQKEMRKETYVEGQTFFMYKRLKLAAIPYFSPWSSNATFSMQPSYYTFPLPEDEKEYGNIPKS
nr:RagB/SusD family nutrient uptake outer membrane protein [uncultured Bacteroides sp.]